MQEVSDVAVALQELVLLDPGMPLAVEVKLQPLQTLQQQVSQLQENRQSQLVASTAQQFLN